MIFHSVALANFSGGDRYAANEAVEVRIRELDGESGALADIYKDEAKSEPISQIGATTDQYGVIEFWAEQSELNVVHTASGEFTSTNGHSMSIRIKSGYILDEAPNDGISYLRSGKAWVTYNINARLYTNNSDAPNDGLVYAQSNGEWVAI